MGSRRVKADTDSFQNFNGGEVVCLSGVIRTVKIHKTMMGNTMAFCVIEDKKGEADVVAFPDAYQQYHELLDKNGAVILEAEVIERNSLKKLSVKKINLIHD